MSNLLLNYLNKRLTENSFAKEGQKAGGPIITISREVGCNGVKLARLLAGRLNNSQKTEKWRVISKEVFFESARELNMDPDEIKKTLHQPERSVLNEFLKAFNEKNYKSDRTIAKTMRNIIHQIAMDGYCIMVGRAGHIIAGDILKSLHIRLIAPLEYRVKTIMENNNLSAEKAVEFIDKVEKERIAFRKSTLGEHFHDNEKPFDIVINRAAFSNEEVLEIIENCARIKNLIP